ncbi:hypothetical protein [Leptolyngbya sp. FACHB-711]|uniref:hypothetical protein n=1 Tax=unclassified Leptolyngbya TaxID=2650499 RepID=UPI001688695C|nr:hypothetical protein [Leptolyngbya sp. FACHB-711]MBD1853559.1 hypothetical protein [Cyanobacteria bacterium FACHB-502]MBD2028079.1 hypothetical protein [Leptolyngbya sp. FACHB-711]
MIKMIKKVLGGLAIGVMVLGGTMLPAISQTCTANCRARQIQFVPGQRIRLQMVNQTASLVLVEQVFRTSPVPILPGQELELDPNFGTEPNISVVFWDETSLPLSAILFRPTPNTLRIEIRPGGRPPGDRSIYIENDGKVSIL